MTKTEKAMVRALATEMGTTGSDVLRYLIRKEHEERFGKVAVR